MFRHKYNTKKKRKYSTKRNKKYNTKRYKNKKYNTKKRISKKYRGGLINNEDNLDTLEKLKKCYESLASKQISESDITLPMVIEECKDITMLKLIKLNTFNKQFDDKTLVNILNSVSSEDIERKTGISIDIINKVKKNPTYGLSQFHKLFNEIEKYINTISRKKTVGGVGELGKVIVGFLADAFIYGAIFVGATVIFKIVNPEGNLAEFQKDTNKIMEESLFQRNLDDIVKQEGKEGDWWWRHEKEKEIRARNNMAKDIVNWWQQPQEER